AGLVSRETRTIPFPGLAAPRSQIAIPVAVNGRAVGVLFGEAEEMMRFSYDDEDALSLLAGYLAARMALLKAEPEEEGLAPVSGSATQEKVVKVRYFDFDQSIFFDHDYLIKGVAGAVLWRLLSLYSETGRSEFSLRELRVDPSLRLPAH